MTKLNSLLVDGRVSNFFDWRPINADGSLGRRNSGYWDKDWSK